METRYLTFSVITKLPKTKIYGVFSKSSGEELGTIKWYSPWKQYCFYPTMIFETVWNKDCLMDINNFLYDLNKPKGDKTNG